MSARTPRPVSWRLTTDDVTAPRRTFERRRVGTRREVERALEMIIERLENCTEARERSCENAGVNALTVVVTYDNGDTRLVDVSVNHAPRVIAAFASKGPT